MTAQRSTLDSFIEAATDAVARAIAGLQREAARERELRDAEHRARMAELAAAIGAVQETERRLAERLVTLKDGEPGRSVTVDDVRPLLDDAVTTIRAEAVAMAGTVARDAVAALPPPEVGLEMVRAAVADAVAALPAPEPGKSVTIDDVRPIILDAVAALPKPEDGKSIKPETVRAMVDEAVGVAVAALPPAPAGPPGKLPVAKAWVDAVHYEGAVVTHEGATWQALRDTGRAPPHEDWICLAKAGRDGADGRSFTVRGTWGEAVEYRALDVVALNGGAFVARKDEPGPCPGDGWQMIAMQGKPGRPGERGIGAKGERGEAGPPVVAMTVDDQGMLTLVNADGSTARCDLYPVLAKLG